MFRSKLIIPALSVACLVASQAVVPTMAIASPLHTVPSLHATYGKHMVNLNLANSTSAPLDVKVGDTPMTIEAGKTVKISAAPGTKITLATASGTREAGVVLAEVSGDLSGATIRIN
jgi:hypothetical protein